MEDSEEAVGLKVPDGFQKAIAEEVGDRADAAMKAMDRPLFPNMLEHKSEES